MWNKAFLPSPQRPYRFHGLKHVCFLLACPAAWALSSSVKVTESDVRGSAVTQPTQASPSTKSMSPSPLQKASFEIASSFQMGKFDPLITDRHMQTIGGFFLRDTEAAYVPRNNPIEASKRIIRSIQTKLDKSKAKKKSFWDVRERIKTPDGDFFDVDTKFADDDKASMVIMLHGLESNSDSDLSHQIASACLANGMSFTCINFRSCSEDENGNIIPNSKLWGCKSRDNCARYDLVEKHACSNSFYV